MIAGVDAPAVLEFNKHILNLVAAFVEHPAERNFGFAIGFGRNAGLYAVRFECSAKPADVLRHHK